MHCDLYILAYFDGGHPKRFCPAPSLIGADIMAKHYTNCSETNQGATYGQNEEHIFF